MINYLAKTALFFLDNIKNKEKHIGKRKKKKMKTEQNNNENAEDFFEDSPPFDLNASFYQMNLSRPLLKVCIWKK